MSDIGESAWRVVGTTSPFQSGSGLQTRAYNETSPENRSDFSVTAKVGPAGTQKLAVLQFPMPIGQMLVHACHTGERGGTARSLVAFVARSQSSLGIPLLGRRNLCQPLSSSDWDLRRCIGFILGGPNDGRPKRLGD